MFGKGSDQKKYANDARPPETGKPVLQYREHTQYTDNDPDYLVHKSNVLFHNQSFNKLTLKYRNLLQSYKIYFSCGDRQSF
jgi:hypothetical protein